MIFRGQIRNGVAVPDGDTHLPDGTPVLIEVEHPASTFWQNKSVPVLAEEQHVSPCEDPHDLVAKWPDNESVDEFLTLIKQARV